MYQLRYFLNIIWTTIIFLVIFKALLRLMSLSIALTIIALTLAVIMVDLGVNANGTLIIKSSSWLYKLVNGLSIKILGLIYNRKYILRK